MGIPKRPLERIDRCGNALVLNFINTVHSRLDDGSRDYLESYEDLLLWAKLEEVLAPAKRRELSRAAQASARRAATALRQARELREALYRILSSSIRGARSVTADTDLALLNRWLARSGQHRVLARDGEGFALAWEHDAADLSAVLWPVAASARELLCQLPHDRLRECPGEEGGCGWLFLDTSKNGTRRWCNMRTCGNLAKARRHRARQRGGA